MGFGNLMNDSIWLISCLALLIFSLIALHNWASVCSVFIKNNLFGSVIPILGGVVGSIGLLVSPTIEIGNPLYLLVPAIIDPGCLPLLLTPLFQFLFELSGEKVG